MKKPTRTPGQTLHVPLPFDAFVSGILKVDPKKLPSKKAKAKKRAAKGKSNRGNQAKG
jgi:hypothetical protein